MVVVVGGRVVVVGEGAFDVVDVDARVVADRAVFGGTVVVGVGAAGAGPSALARIPAATLPEAWLGTRTSTTSSFAAVSPSGAAEKAANPISEPSATTRRPANATRGRRRRCTVEPSPPFRWLERARSRPNRTRACPAHVKRQARSRRESEANRRSEKVVELAVMSRHVGTVVGLLDGELTVADDLHVCVFGADASINDASLLPPAQRVHAVVLDPTSV